MSATQNPYMKFYVSDWCGDKALGVCSLAARGLWIEMLCIMHDADGYLTINGRPVTEAQLVRLTGTPLDTITDLIGELEDAGVFSRNKSNVIYSRRIIRDRKKSQEGKKSIKKRWGQPIENKEKISRPNRSPNRPPTREPNTQKPETRNQNTPKPPEGDFEEFWKTYPNKVAKKKAEVVYRKFIKAGHVTHAELMDGLSRYLAHLKATEWLNPAHATSWLNGGRWVDEYETSGSSEQDIWDVRMGIYQRDGVWPEEWGPSPAEQGCEAPEQYLRKAS